MNKIKISSVLFVLMFSLLATFVHAEEASVNKSLPQVSIENLKVEKNTYNAGESVTGTFVMVNYSDRFVEGLSYGVSVVGGYTKDNIPLYTYDTLKVKDPMSFNPKEKKEIRFSYAPPRYIDGEKGIEINAYASNNSPLGWAESERILFVSDVTEVYFDSAKISTNDGKKYELENGPTVKKDGPASKVYFSFKLSNLSDQFVKVTPTIKVFKQFDQKNILDTLKGEQISLNPDSDSKQIEIELPVFNYEAGVYTGSIDLLDENGNKRSQTLPIRYIVGGDIATIHSFTSKQQSVKEGEPIDLYVSYTGSPIDIAEAAQNKDYKVESKDLTLKVEIFNEKNVVVASFSTTTPNSSTSYDIQIEAEESAAALRGVASIFKGDKLLFEKKVMFSPNYVEIQDKNSAFNDKLAIILGTILLIASLYLALRKSGFVSNKILVLILIAVALIAVVIYAFYPTSRASSYTLVSGSSNTSANGMYISTPVDGQVLDAGKNFALTGRAWYDACYNAPTNFSARGYMSDPSQSILATQAGIAQGDDICKTKRECKRKEVDGKMVDYACKTVKYGCLQNHHHYSGNIPIAFTLRASSTPKTNNEAFMKAVFSNGVYGYEIIQKVTFSTENFGKCGTATSTIVESMPTGYPSACLFGTQENAATTTLASNKSTLDWECNNPNGYGYKCSADLVALCGESHGENFSTVPKTGLCYPGHGQASAVTTAGGVYSWKCTGAGTGNVKSCTAYKSAACGTTANLASVKVKPTTNLCIAGTSASAVTVNTQTNEYVWTCSNGGVGNVSNCSVPAVSTCGTLGDTGADKIATGKNVNPASVGLCAVENSLLGAITVNYGNGVWSWACQNVALPPADSCSASCAAGTYYCENTNTCSATCNDWCPASADGNPAGNQTVRKSFLDIDASGKCSIAQIDKFFLRPAIADKTNNCYAFWNLKATSTDRTVTCSLDEQPVSCGTALSAKTAVGPGEHVFRVNVGVDQSVPADKIPDYYLSEEEKVKCVSNPSHKEQ